MLKDTDLIKGIHQTAEMGCEGILAVIDYAGGSGLKNVLEQQLKDYRGFEAEAEKLLAERGERAEGIGVMAKTSARAMSAGKLMLDHSVSKIAEMMIEGSSMGISKTIEHLHSYAGDEQSAVELANRFVAAQRANVEQLQAYL